MALQTNSLHCLHNCWIINSQWNLMNLHTEYFMKLELTFQQTTVHNAHILTFVPHNYF